jgi:hypothetical protein
LLIHYEIVSSVGKLPLCNLVLLNIGIAEDQQIYVKSLIELFSEIITQSNTISLFLSMTKLFRPLMELLMSNYP